MVKAKARSRPCRGRVKARKDLGEVKARSMQHKNNLNHNYNLMDFDTIKINLVFRKKLHVNCSESAKQAIIISHHKSLQN